MNGTRICSVADCDNPFLAKGLCAKHWRRNRLYGDPSAMARPPSAQICAVAACLRSDVQGWDLCRMHYHRMWRTGGLTARPQRPRRGVCIIDNCGKTDCGPDGLCTTHKSRLRRNGDPLLVLTTSPGKGEDNHRWVGDEASYSTLHLRVRKHLGKASRHNCVDCNKSAAHWSYNNSGVREIVSDNGRRYSLDIDQYEPRCVSCHSLFDAAARRSKQAGDVR